MSVVTITILSEGQEMNPAFSLLSIDVTKEINRIPTARLMLIDGDAPAGNFAVSNEAFFEPGKAIEIKLRYEGRTSDETIFKGLAVRHGIEARENRSVITIELKDAAIKLTTIRKSKVFRNKSDGDIIAEILQETGLQKGAIAATEPAHGEIVQYYATDWDFMLSRVDSNGLILSADDGEISVQEISLEGQATHRFEFGIDSIYEFEMEADAVSQYNGVESIAWDMQHQELTQPSAAENFSLSQGNLDGSSLAQAMGFDTCTLSHPVPLAPAELQAWANGRMVRSRLAMIRGRIRVDGLAGIKTMAIMEIAGIGDRFNGNTLITGVRHRIDHLGWHTDIQFGVSPEPFCRNIHIPEVPAGGLLPPVSGLQIGIVDAFEDDPDSEYRLKVMLPALAAPDASVWARLAAPDAGENRGWFFRPEPGDEVVVGFFNNDPRQAVIIGSMYGSKNTPPETFSEVTEENLEKGLTTRGGTVIGFKDDSKASVFIETPESNKITIDDDAQSIQICDQHGNTVTMDQDGIEIKSAKDIVINADGNVEIMGQQVDVK